MALSKENLLIHEAKRWVGIIVGVNTDSSLMTIEGNTSSSEAGKQREGDGVCLKRRTLDGVRNLQVKGFLRVW